MLRICLASDNHGNMEAIYRILSENQQCDYYLHCGDACADPEDMSPFACVKGNNDWDTDYPRIRIFETRFHRIMMIHGDGYTYFLNRLAKKAKEEKCNIVFYGHTHTFKDEYIDGVRLINPGSCSYNRDFSTPCYAIVTINDDGNMIVEKKLLE